MAFYTKKSKKILCYRRYSEFDKFYNTLKFRYPHCIFPRLSEKKIVGNSERIFLENRRKELQYFINRLYYHEEISKSEDPNGFEESKPIAREGGKIAGDARKALEKRIGKKVISKSNANNPKLLDEIG